MRRRRFALPLAILLAASPAAGRQAQPSAEVLRYVSVREPVVALVGARVIDGTGTAAVTGHTILLREGRIDAIGPDGQVTVPSDARVIDATGRTIIPGLVGMHNHTYFSYGGFSTQMWYTGPRLYLAGGVTTIRTAGSQHPYAELNMKRSIDAGLQPGPRVHPSGPYLNGAVGAGGAQSPLLDEEDARRVVAYWAEEGATWLKASGGISRAVLAAVIDEAHKHGLGVTGHLCSVTFREAASLGIDNLEHGLITNSDYIANKQPDVCPPDNMVAQVNVDLAGPAVAATFRDLVEHDVAVTSTLSVYEGFMPDRAPLDARVLDALAPHARESLTQFREQLRTGEGLTVPVQLFEKMMRWERDFAAAGGMLVAGVDPWGSGSLPGYGDQRNYELLVEAGFAAHEAVRIMTLNGATLLEEEQLYGSLVPGKRADLVVLSGDLTSDPSVIRNVEMVFRDGIGYDPAKLIADVAGQVGIR